MKKPKKDGIAEMLAAGRACGAIVRGADSYHYDQKNRVEVIPNPSDPHNAAQAESAEQRVWEYHRERALEAKKRQRESGHMKKSGSMRHVASTPIRQWMATQKQEGEDCFRKGNSMDTLRRIGRTFDGE